MKRSCLESAGVGAGKVARWGEAALQGIVHRWEKRGLSKVWTGWQRAGRPSREQAGYCVKQAYLGNRQAIG